MDAEIYKFPKGEKMTPEDLKDQIPFIVFTQTPDGIRYQCRNLNLRFLMVAKRSLDKFIDEAIGFKCNSISKGVPGGKKNDDN